jgi:hypothetical protein
MGGKAQFLTNAVPSRKFLEMLDRSWFPANFAPLWPEGFFGENFRTQGNNLKTLTQ